MTEPKNPEDLVEEIEVDPVPEPEDVGCGDDTAREMELEGPLDEPLHQEIEVAGT